MSEGQSCIHNLTDTKYPCGSDWNLIWHFAHWQSAKSCSQW